MISNFARRVGDKDKKKRKSKSLIDGISAIGAGLGGGLNYYLAKRRQKQALNSK
jgi:hypothetical protein